MKVAVVGSGIAGMVSAYHLAAEHEVTLYEAEARLGGHTDTHAICVDDRTTAVDSGFIVCNDVNYPNLLSWFEELGVSTQPSDMSFGVRCLSTGLEYGTTGINALFAQRRNLLTPSFWRMLKDLRHFYNHAHTQRNVEASVTLGDYLANQGYATEFAERHLIPMCSAIWSQPRGATLKMPIRYVVQFMEHHLLLQFTNRPMWRVVSGGSSQYVQAFEKQFRGRVRKSTPVTGVVRESGSVWIETRNDRLAFDAVFMACHGDQALALLNNPSASEQDVLGSFKFQENRVVVHSDAAVMPENPRAWSSWNALVGSDESSCQVTYWMNRLQGFDGDNFFVTLNPTQEVNSLWLERHYTHPIIDEAALLSQGRLGEINGAAQVFFCGAYWGWGFHEDGVVSALKALEQFNVKLARAA